MCPSTAQSDHTSQTNWVSRSCWCALAGHQMSLCVCLSSWLVVCCWYHVLSCLLSDPSLLVISLLFQLPHLWPPRYPPRLSPHVFSWCLQSCAVWLSNVRCHVVCVLPPPACLPAPAPCFIIKTPIFSWTWVLTSSLFTENDTGLWMSNALGHS